MKSARWFLLIAAVASTGCSGGRLTLFDPLQRGLARGHVRRGAQLQREGRANAAERAFSRAVASDPLNENAHAGIGSVCFERKQYKAAADAYRRALKCNPYNFNVCLALGDALSLEAETSMNRDRLFNAAERAYRYARTLRSDSVEAARGLARAYARQGKSELAAQTFAETAALESGRSTVAAAPGE